MPIIPPVDGGALLNALRMGRQDREAFEDRSLQRMFTQQKMDEVQEQKAARTEAHGLYASGDKRGARERAVAGGAFDYAKALGEMEAADLEAAGKRAELVGNVAQWADTPEKWDKGIDYLVQSGYADLEQYRGKYSPEGRMSAISAAGQVKEYMDRTKPVNMSPGGRLVDPATGKVIAEAPFAPRPVTVGDGETVVEYVPGGDGSRGKGADGEHIESIVTGAVPGVTVTSRDRSPERNSAVGGVANSYHLTGQARDFVPPQGMSMGALAAAIKEQMPGFDVINEGDHVHVEPGPGTAAAERPRVIAQGAPKSKTKDAPSGYRWSSDGTRLEPIPGGPSEAKSKVPDRKAAADLRKEFNNLPEVKDFKDVQASFAQIAGIAKKKNATAQDDIALVFSFMKMLDPGSVVRETEYATAANAAGVPDRVRNIFNRALNGERLTATQRLEMVRTARSIYDPRVAKYNQKATEYQGYARDYGVDPASVARRYVVPSKAKPGGGKPSVSNW